MQLMDQALLDLVTSKQIDPDQAYLYAEEKKHFERYVTDRSMLPGIDLEGAGQGSVQ
jgi:twitching motility protein PilT